MKPEVSIVFPAYNEADNIEAVLHDFQVALEGLRVEWIVVNDGSRDQTQQVLDSLDIPNLQVVHHKVNQGYGAALCSGFAVAKGEWTFFTDSDRQFNPTDFWHLWNRRTDADLVLGVRAERHDPPIRKLNAWLWGQYIKRVFSVDVADLNCAFKLLPTAQLQSFSLQSRGAFINAELLSLFHEASCGWIEIPVNHSPRQQGQQTGANPKVILKAFGESLRFLRRKNRHLSV